MISNRKRWIQILRKFTIQANKKGTDYGFFIIAERMYRLGILYYCATDVPITDSLLLRNECTVNMFIVNSNRSRMARSIYQVERNRTFYCQGERSRTFLNDVRSTI